MLATSAKANTIIVMASQTARLSCMGFPATASLDCALGMIDYAKAARLIATDVAKHLAHLT